MTRLELLLLASAILARGEGRTIRGAVAQAIELADELAAQLPEEHARADRARLNAAWCAAHERAHRDGSA